MLKHFLVFLLPNLIFCQLELTEIELPKILRETSALEYYRGNFITLNDSGGEPKLYSFNSYGEILNEYKINGSVNRDWESLAADNNNFYISDTGNRGNRKDLTIYILDQSLVLKDSIQINYKTQKKFKKKKKDRYDAEALVSFGSDLLLFSKDWKNYKTQIHIIPKKSGSYSLQPIAEVEVNSLITGGDYDPLQKKLVLTGTEYTKDNERKQYLILFSNFDLKNINNITFDKHQIPVSSAQIEAIKISDSETFWLTSENEGTGFPRLFKVCLSDF